MFEIEKPKALYSSPWFIITIIVIIAAVGVGGYFLLKGGEPEGREPDFEVSANPASISIPQGSSENVTITIRSINGFSSEVAQMRITEPGEQIDTTLDFPSRTPPPNGEIDGTLTIEIFSTASVGKKYTITIIWDENRERLWDPDLPSYHTVKITVTVISGVPYSGDKEIYIYGNDDFTPANGVTSGSGTADNPYIIENYIIDASQVEANGIDIRNTTAHFVVRNCLVENGPFWTYVGIYLHNVVNGRVENNTLKNNPYGIHLSNLDNNLISNNTCSNNGNGIRLGSSSNNTLSNNTCENNGYNGIYLWDSDNNLIYHNNFLNNGTQADDDGSNYWDDGYPSGGNYWSDYTGVDADGDGIGDEPYIILGDNNQDRYPLMNPV